jgi:hypothetical protein
MSGTAQDLWRSRTLPDSITLELRAGDNPALALLQGENRLKVELAHITGVVAALADAAADPAELLAVGGQYHAWEMDLRIALCQSAVVGEQ